MRYVTIPPDEFSFLDHGEIIMKANTCGLLDLLAYLFISNLVQVGAVQLFAEASHF